MGKNRQLLSLTWRLSRQHQKEDPRGRLVKECCTRWVCHPDQYSQESTVLRVALVSQPWNVETTGAADILLTRGENRSPPRGSAFRMCVPAIRKCSANLKYVVSQIPYDRRMCSWGASIMHHAWLHRDGLHTASRTTLSMLSLNNGTGFLSKMGVLQAARRCKSPHRHAPKGTSWCLLTGCRSGRSSHAVAGSGVQRW